MKKKAFYSWGLMFGALILLLLSILFSSISQTYPVGFNSPYHISDHPNNFTHVDRIDIEQNGKDSISANINFKWNCNYFLKIIVLNDINYNKYQKNESYRSILEKSFKNGSFELEYLRNDFDTSSLYVIEFVDIENNPMAFEPNAELMYLNITITAIYEKARPITIHLSDMGLNSQMLSIVGFTRNVGPAAWLGIPILLFSISIVLFWKGWKSKNNIKNANKNIKNKRSGKKEKKKE
jgi:hypothetical protein